jgi:hypothetical protein
VEEGKDCRSFCEAIIDGESFDAEEGYLLVNSTAAVALAPQQWQFHFGLCRDSPETGGRHECTIISRPLLDSSPT